MDEITPSQYRMECWLPVDGYGEHYYISDYGRVLSFYRKTPRILKPGSNGTHRFVHLTGTGNVYIHHLVAEAFIGPRPPGQLVRHLNGIATDNRPENLAYGTYSDNAHDTVRHGHNVCASKTHCPKGHEYTPENTYSRPSRNERSCRKCTREATKRWFQNKKNAQDGAA